MRAPVTPRRVPIVTRKIVLVWHRRIALTLAPLLMLQALSGLVLLLPQSESTRVVPALPSKLVASAEAALPGYHVTRLDYQDTVEAYLADRAGNRAFADLDPATALVVHRGSIWSFPRRLALEWHYSLLTGTIGSKIVLLEACGLIVLALSGLTYWWPGRARIAQALRIPARAPKRLKLRLWHRSTGVLASLLLLMTASTGVLLVWPMAVPGPATTSADRTLPLDFAYARASALTPGQPVRDFRFSGPGKATLHFAAKGSNHWMLDTVTFDAAGVAHLSTAASAPELWMRLLPLHTGDGLAGVGKLVIASVACALLFLAGSGVLAWYRSRKGKR